MEDLWKRTEDLDCEVCGGQNDCPRCGKIIAHYPEYVYRILIQLAKFKMPGDELLRFVEFADASGLWLEVGHWTICCACESLWIHLKDYSVNHHRCENRNTLEVWNRRKGCREWEPVYSATWIEPDDPIVLQDQEVFGAAK